MQARVGQLPPDHPAPLRRLGGPRPVERQNQFVQESGQRLLPLPHLPGQNPAVRRILVGVPEQVSLP